MNAGGKDPKYPENPKIPLAFIRLCAILVIT